jgi:hypothetical protein
LGGQLSDAAAITGISADKMLILQQAFANAGMSGESAAGVIAKLQAAIGRAGFMSEETEEEISELRDRVTELRGMKAGMDPKEQAKVNKEIEKTQKRIDELQSEAKGVQKAFQMLGLNQASMAQMDGASQLQAVFEALGRLDTQSDKLAALRMLRLPPDLMVLAKDPNAFKDAAKQLGMLSPLMGQFAGQFDRISDILNAKPGILFKQIGAGFLKELTGSKTLNEALNWFEALDLTSVGEKIGAQAAALVEIVRNTVNSNGEGIWGALVLGFEFVSAKAVELFVTASQYAAAISISVMRGLFSEAGMEMAGALAAVLVGGLTIATTQVVRLIKAMMMKAENEMKKSALGRFLAGSASMLRMGIPGQAGEGMSDLQNSIFSSPKSDAQVQKEIDEMFRQPVTPIGMELDKLIEATAGSAGTVVKSAGEIAQNIAKAIPEELRQMRELQGQNPAKSASDEALGRLIQGAGPNGQRLYDQLFNARPAVPIGIERQQVPNTAPKAQEMKWQFDQAKNQQTSDNKQISLMEQTVALLERNLTAMQVA